MATPTRRLAKPFNVLSGLTVLAWTYLEVSRNLSNRPWAGMVKSASLVDFVLVPLWVAAALVFMISRRANDHYIFLWGAMLMTFSHGLFVVISGNQPGYFFLAGVLLVGMFQGLRIHFSGTSAIEKMYPRHSEHPI